MLHELKNYKYSILCGLTYIDRVGDTYTSIFYYVPEIFLFQILLA